MAASKSVLDRINRLEKPLERTLAVRRLAPPMASKLKEQNPHNILDKDKNFACLH